MSYRKKIAVVVTTFFPGSHASTLVTKLIEGFNYQGKIIKPKFDVASIYLDQIHIEDLGIALAKKHKINVYKSIRGALTLTPANDGDPPISDGSELMESFNPNSSGTSMGFWLPWEPGELSVDGVVIIGEHGDYSIDQHDRQLYPRRHFFEQVCAVFARSGHSVPVFTDKHLSHNWEDALWIYNRAKNLDVTLMAGSSLPLEKRHPDLQHKIGAHIQEAISIGHHHDYPNALESYGFHCLETLQCMVERRHGGETGISSVQCLEGEDVWLARERGVWSGELAEAANAVMTNKKSGSMDQNSQTPTAFILEYQDGFRGTALMLPGHLQGFGYAARVNGEIYNTSFERISKGGVVNSSGKDIQGLKIQEMVLTGKAAYPVERTLLVTGAIDALFKSKRNGNIKIQTPHLDIKYNPQ